MPQTTQTTTRIQAALETSEPVWAIQPAAFQALLEGEARASMVPVRDPDKPAYEVQDGVAVIPVEGVLSRDGWWGTSTRAVGSALEAALHDASVRAILFSIYSPGGSVTGIKELADSIAAATRVKPCAAYVDGLCASAAYWLASATGRVYSGPSATVGSIGVLIRHTDFSGAYKSAGINITYVTAGVYKAAANSDSPLSDRDRQLLQERADAIYKMFCGDVAERMGLAMDQSDTWANGRDFLAADAEQLGLVTALTTTRTGAVGQLIKETHMTREELQAKHPELWASLQQEAKNMADGLAREAARETAQRTNANMLALVQAVCGAAVASKIEALVAASVTPEQMQACAAALQQEKPAAPAAPQPQDMKTQMLAGIQAATPGAVRTAAVQENDALATIKRIGGMKL